MEQIEITETTKKKLFVKIPSHIVRNEEKYLSNDEFVLYARLCFLYFRNYQKKEIVLDHTHLMRFLKISDTRTFKRRLKKLYQVGFIENEVTKLPTKGNLIIQFNETIYDDDKHFTKLDSSIFNSWSFNKIDEYAFRQVFYYKSHINKDDKERDRSFCFVGYDTLVKRLKVSKTKINDANEQLKSVGLLKVVPHKLETNYSYNDNDELIYFRFNNHYYLDNSLF